MEVIIYGTNKRNIVVWKLPFLEEVFWYQIPWETNQMVEKPTFNSICIPLGISPDHWFLFVNVDDDMIVVLGDVMNCEKNKNKKDVGFFQRFFSKEASS